VDLRTTLLEAAVALIGEVGPRAFTLREVARRAGVSHNAPYRHFAGKDELLAAVAAEGFDRLTAAMERAMKPGRTPLERLQLCGCGYVDFALRWPLHLPPATRCRRRGRRGRWCMASRSWQPAATCRSAGVRRWSLRVRRRRRCM